ncbi:MAG: helix-turn-helix domain-containing protein [Ignavibacteriaceae bacterium]|nr:helix-turn-helix domain-containing protein [Ignavibacteriaceae bacterium]
MKQNRLAKKIKLLRTERAWSQAQLAEVASLSIRTVQRVEIDGKCSHESLLAFASAFDIDVKELTVLLDQITSNVKFSFSVLGYNFSFGWLKSITAFWAGIIMVFPAVYFILASILKYNFGISFLFETLGIFFSSYEMLKVFNLVSPVIFLFGLLGAFIINFLTMFSIRLWKDKNIFQSEISFSPRTLNLFVSGLSMASLMIMFTYAVVENFIIR